MAERVLHKLFPGERVVIKRHSACQDSHGCQDSMPGVVVSVRATESHPFFWYCIQGPKIQLPDYWCDPAQVRNWFAARFIRLPPGPLELAERGMGDAEDVLRVRVGSDVLITPWNPSELLRTTPETLYRVCEMFIRGKASQAIFRVPSVSIGGTKRYATSLTDCTLVNRLGRTRIYRLEELVPSVIGEIIAGHAWKPLTAPRSS